jgi:acetyl-CoA carboxylase biotin carboxylase subunit
MHRPIHKVLVANRGEIACRVIRTLKKMGIASVAVYSEADLHAPFVAMADEAVLIGPPPSSQSYLVQEKILQVAKDKNVDAIHPGYGFLSENPAFALLLEANGIILIGPSAHSMEIMGNKLAAKDAVKNFNIPLVPGTDYALSDVAKCKEISQAIGFPVLIKAAAGGGGKGMRLVRHIEEMEEQLSMAMGEAQSAFGDSSVFIEKYVEEPRHIEFQVLADNYGNTVHLFERECSIQRRHQKVVEEAPSAVLTSELRHRMGEAAVNVAKSCNYSGAGTVEFLVDKNLNFYFLEMNTRLQVEHPVTEMITGIDLVEQQIRVAQGEKLSFSQEDLFIKGHAIELRVYAEDPFNSFLPSINTLDRYRIPIGENIRVDDGFREGMEIPMYYDPMIAKLATFGVNRQAAINTMKKAIHEYEIEGIETTLDFGNFVMHHPSFVSGKFDTSFINQYFSQEQFDAQNSEVNEAAAAFIEGLSQQ